MLLIFVIGKIGVDDQSCDAAAVFNEIVEYLVVAVTVVVVAVPEGLPLAVTIALSASMGKMKEQNVLVKKLKACETMGGATNVCTDKTGTLTENKMTLTKGWFASVECEATESVDALVDALKSKFKDSPMVLEAFKEGCTVNTEGTSVVTMEDYTSKTERPKFMGNPTECAMIRMVQILAGKEMDYVDNEQRAAKYNNLVKDAGHALYGQCRRQPFSSSRKRMTTIIGKSDVIAKDGSLAKEPKAPEAPPVLWTKGAGEIVLDLCTHFLDQNGQQQKLDDDAKTRLSGFTKKLQSQGLRAICVAYRPLPDGNAEPNEATCEGWTKKGENNAYVIPSEKMEKNLTILCMVGIKDPLRAGVDQSVLKLTRAGIKVRMVTGDNAETATFIAQDANILEKGKDGKPAPIPAPGSVIEGPDFRKLSTAEMKDRLTTGIRVMARSSPLDKEKLVNCLKEMGEVVAVTGDGTNDAPALHTADVGMAMGIAGTEVAKAAADIVLLDDSFNSIVTACKWGRNVYDSVRKFLQFQLTVNVVACTLVFIAAITDQGMPLNAVQLLWVNLIMDSFGALALATEDPNENELLQREPDGRNDPLISRKMWRNILVQSAFQLVVLLVLLYSGKNFMPADLDQQVSEGTDTEKDDAKLVHCLNECKEQNHILSGCRELIKNRWNLIDPQQAPNQDTKEAVFPGCGKTDITCQAKQRSDALLCPRQKWDCPGCELPDDKNLKIGDLSEIRATKILNTVIFNAFVFCQVFNEFNARRIDKVNVFEGIIKHWMFLVIILITVGMQVLMVEVLKKFVDTDTLIPCPAQWLLSIAIGALSLPIGVVMHLIPVQDADKVADPGIAAKQKIRQVLVLDDNFNAELRPLEPSDNLLKDLTDFIAQASKYNPQPSVGTIHEQLKSILKQDDMFKTAPEPSSKLVTSLYKIMAPKEEEDEKEDDNLQHVIEAFEKHNIWGTDPITVETKKNKASVQTIKEVLDGVGDIEKVVNALVEEKVESAYLPEDYKKKVEEAYKKLEDAKKK